MGRGTIGERIAIVEDHGLIAHTVASAFVAVGLDARVVEPVAGTALVDQVLDASPDVALLDLDLGPAGSGDRLIEPLAAAGVTVLILTGIQDEVRLARSVLAGARGVVDKGSPFRELWSAVDRAQGDGGLVSKAERDEMAALVREHDRDHAARFAPFENLTDREAEVLGELMQGRNVEEVARSWFVSIATVRSQIRAIRRKLGVTSQVAAVARARTVGWVPPQER